MFGLKSTIFLFVLFILPVHGLFSLVLPYFGLIGNILVFFSFGLLAVLLFCIF